MPTRLAASCSLKFAGMGSPAVDKRMIVRFLGLLFVLSLPFLALAQWIQTEPLPGLPLSGLIALCPALAAVVLVGTGEGWRGVLALLARSFDAARVAGWPGG